MMMQHKKALQTYLNKYTMIAFLFTSLNILAGVMGIYLSLRGDVVVGFQLLILGTIFDFLDGFFAKKAPKTTVVGFYADSFGDVITFAILPAYLVLKAYEAMNYPIDWISPPTILIAALYTICGWIRLVRFAARPSGNKFEGLPSPAAALLVGSLSVLITFEKPGFLEMLVQNEWIFSLLVITTSILMVTTIKYPSPKRKATSDLILIGVAGVIVLFFVVFPHYITVSLVLFIALFYSFVGPYYYTETEKLLVDSSTLSYKKGK